MAEQLAQIAVALAYLKAELGAKNGKTLSIEALCGLLNEAAGADTPFVASKIFSFRRGQFKPAPPLEREWIRVIEKFCAEREYLRITKLSAIPADILAQYASPLAQPKSIDSDFAGEIIQDPNIFCGAWRFFYVSPVTRAAQYQHEIRGVVAVFRPIEGENNKLDVQMISRSTHWSGVAFAFEWHLYIVCQAKDKSETAFFVVDKPSKSQYRFVAGLGSALERGDPERMHRHPAMGVLCFGEKCHGESLSPRSKAVQALSPTVVAALDKLMAGDELADEDEETLRAEFKVTYSTLNQLANKHPELVAHLKKHVRVNQREFGMKSLLVEWH